MGKKSLFNKKDPALTIAINKQKELPPRIGLVYEPTMDNVIIEAVFTVPEVKDGETPEYIAPHLRATDYVKVVALGPLVDNKSLNIIIGSRVILDPRVRVTSIEMDEIGYVGVLKPHEIIAIIV